ncbi:YdcF family protein [Rhodovulum adriaticum]|uniref:YdcF family protein n=1 Tax=Rhodovulum adriaticum TaxID=35804 RepID=UPI001050B099|nr:YdcF family protein [Rhodovulum adriaticum]MBK1636532.1 hypothetical protein [Rhodovulum adriaticum]
MYELIKFLSLFTYPLGVTFLLAGAAVLCRALGRRRLAAGLGAVAFIWLWVWSMPVTSERLRGGLEARYANLPVGQAPEADAIVVLGGAFSTNEAWPYPNASGSIDRYWHGARLYHAGRADLIVLTGGGSPNRPDKLTEAEAGALFLVDLGVPPSAIVLDTASRTTRDHTDYLEPILRERGLEQLLLVTSATHMRRAEAVFRRAGFDVVPVATDFSVGPDPVKGPRRYMPSVGALGASTAVIHEYLGYWFYRLLGKV